MIQIHALPTGLSGTLTSQYIDKDVVVCYLPPHSMQRSQPYHTTTGGGGYCDPRYYIWLRCDLTGEKSESKAGVINFHKAQL